jgi:hypothetical protein
MINIRRHWRRLVADIIDMTELRETQAAEDATARLQAAADATARLHDVLCRATEATATGALNTRGRLLLAAGVARAALGPGWSVSYTGE